MTLAAAIDMPQRSTPPFSGFVLSDGRRGGICWGKKPRCTSVDPKSHRLVLRDPVLTDAIATCRHRQERSAPICGAQVYVRRFPKSLEEAQLWLVVEVTPEHIERMKREPMIFLERMVILGVALPGVELDLLGRIGE